MAGFLFNSGINLDKNEIQNPLFHKSGSDISSPLEGQFYYNTGTKKPRWYDGTAWQEIGTGAITGSGATDRIAVFSGTSAITSVSTFVLSSGNLGVGLSGPTARIHALGANNTAGVSSLLIQNAATTQLISVENDGLIQVGPSVGTVSTNVSRLRLGWNGTSAGFNGTAQLLFGSQYGNTPFSMGAEANGYNFIIRQTNGGQGTFEFNFGTISSVLYQRNFTYNTDHYEDVLTGKWLTRFSGAGTGGNYYGFNNNITSNGTSTVYDTFRVSKQTIGNWPLTNEPLLSFFNGNSTASLTGTNKYVARINRWGFLGIGTDTLYNGTATNNQQAGITVNISPTSGVHTNDGTTAIRVRTVGSSTAVDFPDNINAAIGLGIMVGTRITANGETRTVVALSNHAGVSVDSAVNWSNGGVGYTFTFTNAYISLQDGATKHFLVDGIGNVSIGLPTPTAYVNIKAGTSAANTSPLKFTSGTNLTTPESGAVEWDGTRLYITQASGPTRKTFAYLQEVVLQGGNSFAGLMTIGTNDNNAVAFEINTVEKMRLDTSGRLQIGGTAGTQLLSLTGGNLSVQDTFGLLSDFSGGVWTNVAGRSGVNVVIGGSGNAGSIIYAGTSNALTWTNAATLRLTQLSADPGSLTNGDTWHNTVENREKHRFNSLTRAVAYVDDILEPTNVIVREDFLKTNNLPALWLYSGDTITLTSTSYAYGYGSYAVCTDTTAPSTNGFVCLRQDADIQPATGNRTYTMIAQVDLSYLPNTTNGGEIWIGFGGGNMTAITAPDDFVGFKINGSDATHARYGYIVRKNGTQTASNSSDITGGVKVLKIVWSSTSVKYYEDDVLLFTQTTMTNNPTGEQNISMMIKANTAVLSSLPVGCIVACLICKIEKP